MILVTALMIIMASSWAFSSFKIISYYTKDTNDTSSWKSGEKKEDDQIANGNEPQRQTAETNCREYR
jgi:hypothetical protein